MGGELLHWVVVVPALHGFDCFDELFISFIVGVIPHGLLLSLPPTTQIRLLDKFVYNPNVQMKKPTPRTPTSISQQNFKIYLRIKPSPQTQPSQPILKPHSSTKIQILSPYCTLSQADKMYQYEQIFMEQSDNQRVFRNTMLVPIDNVLQGYNSTVFIYGMTGAGKTYTMFGGPGEGLVGRSVQYMFGQIDKQPGTKTQILLSFYEIYNESIRDLFQQQANMQNLNIMQDPIHGVSISNLTQIPITSKSHMRVSIHLGLQRRAMNVTKSNQASSRSHAILQFNIRRYVTINQNQVSVLESKFFMIDLAGNQKTSQNQSRRFIQGVNINKSLLTLGKCLSILAERKGGYVPFRDSKLTRILKQSLGGNSKTVMIACVANEKKYYQETLNTLKYSNIAKRIRNKGIRNNVKIVSKDEVGQNKNYVNNGNSKFNKQQHQNAAFVGGVKQYQHRIRQMMSTFLTAAEKKLSIQKVQQDLEVSLRQNQELMNSGDADVQACRANVDRITSTLKQLMKPYEKLLQRLGNSYSQIIQATHSYIHGIIKQEFTHRDQQIRLLKQTVQRQRIQIKQLSPKQPSQNNQIQHICTRRLSIDVSKSVGISQQPVQQQNVIAVVNLNSTRAVNKSVSKKKLTLNCINTQEPVVRRPLQMLDISLPANNIESQAGEDRKRVRQHKEIVIDLRKTDQNNHIMSNKKGNKQQFIRKLKQTEKKAKGAENSQICSILQQQQAHKYELTSTEMSMIRKLKFFQRERSLQKTHSLTKIISKNHPTSRSIAKY